VQHPNRFERYRAWTGLGIVLVLTIVGLAGFELLLRFSGLGAALVHDTRPLIAERYLQLREYPPNATLRFAPPPLRASSGDFVADIYTVQTDEHGFIEPGRIHREPDVTIAFLGGSTTECLFVAPESRFPFLIGREIERQLGIKVNTINAARSGNNTQHLLLALQGKLLGLQPDIVVLMEATNDIGILSRLGSYWADDETFGIVQPKDRGIAAGVRLIRDATVGYTYRLVREGMRRVVDFVVPILGFRAANAQTAPPHGVEDWARQYRASLTQFVETSRAWNIRPVLMTQVTLAGGDRIRTGSDAGNYLADDVLKRGGFSAESFDTTHAYFNAIARHVASRHGAGMIDLAAEEWNTRQLYDGLHFSDPGSRRVAELAAPRLAEEIRALLAARRGN
jgi:lysophospholipase L1-like esterase